MPLQEDLNAFADSISTATGDAPDEYPAWSSLTYETHMDDLKGLWAAIRPQLKDLQQAEIVDGKLLEMISAFDCGDKDKGRAAAWFLYNFGLTGLK